MEEELRELRLELKTARSEVKRYASYALRLQQELAWERQNRGENNENEILETKIEDDGRRLWASTASVWERKVELSTRNHRTWDRKLENLIHTLNPDGSSVEETNQNAPRDNQGELSTDMLCKLQASLCQQQRFITELNRENLKLRDMVKMRPTRRELVCSQLEVERLQRQLRKFRVREMQGKAGESDPSLTDRIAEGQLLRILRVKTEDSEVPRGYLKEKVHCYLFLDPERLEKQQRGIADAAIAERVGRVCSDIVASCCYVLDVKEVGELPHFVEEVHQRAQLSSVYQGFTERLAKLLTRFNVNIFGSVPESVTKSSYHEALEEILSRVADALVELDARREQMKPPGSKAHQVLLKCMKLLGVSRVDQLVSTLRRLVDNMQAEQTFQQDLRDLFGLEDATTRKEILNVASILFHEVGLGST